MTLLLCIIAICAGLLVAIGALLTYGQALSAIAMFSAPVLLVAVIAMTIAFDTDTWRFVVALVPMGLAVISLFIPNDSSENLITSIRRARLRRQRATE